MRGRGVSALAFLVYAMVTATVVVTQEAPGQEAAVQREAATMSAAAIPATEAPAGFDGGSNGFLSDNTTPTFEEAEEEFIGPETAEEGLGPVFNAAGCGECHAVPIVGGSSQIVERRAGRWDGRRFTDHPGGSLIQDRSLFYPQYPQFRQMQEDVLPGHNVIALRASLSVLGLGFVEAIDSNDLAELASDQPASMRGQIIQIPVLEAPGSNRVGRFGWKNQHASLLSFSGDAYANEMGISTPLFPFENTFNGQAVPLETDPFPEANGVTDDSTNEDLDLFAAFMRSTKVPPRDAVLAATADARRGEQLFSAIGCATCHTPTLVTVPAGTRINGGTFTVPSALASKVIHPFSDFLLHDIGTGDGIVQNGGTSTRNKLRTVPLWGLRVRGRFMHDLLSMSVSDAIQRHDGQASGVRTSFNNLSSGDRNRVLTFLRSL